MFSVFVIRIRSLRLLRVSGIVMCVRLLLLLITFLKASHSFFFFQAEDGIRDLTVTGVQTCALPILSDASGANVEGAKVAIKNLATDQLVEVTTDSSGAYAANVLRIGAYSVTVEKQGFKKAVEPNVGVGVNQVVRVNLTLQVGSTTESVEEIGRASCRE